MPMLAVARREPFAVVTTASLRIATSSSSAIRARLALVDVRQDDRELVAAEARDGVGAPQTAAEDVGDGRDELVAGAVAERVVDVLEVVEVEREHRAAGAVALRRGELAGELLLEAAAVEERGDRVVVGEVLELALEALALGDVLHLGDAVQRAGRRRRG